VPMGWPDLGPGALSLRLESERDAVIMLRGREFRRITASSWDASVRLADMDADGIGIQVVSPTPVFFSYPFWLGRMDNAWRRRREVVGTSDYPPSHYNGRFYVDSVVFDEPAVRLLADTLGTDRIVVGSDYPYPLGESPAGGVVHGAAFLSEEGREAILVRNAYRFLGLPALSPRTGARNPWVRP
jgi:hypothetical protein